MNETLTLSERGTSPILPPFISPGGNPTVCAPSAQLHPSLLVCLCECDATELVNQTNAMVKAS